MTDFAYPDQSNQILGHGRNFDDDTSYQEYFGADLGNKKWVVIPPERTKEGYKAMFEFTVPCGYMLGKI
jgi:hypothetical protein